MEVQGEGEMESVDTGLDYGFVSAWEENIWLDRRETACSRVNAAVPQGTQARLVAWAVRAKARMQLGPVASDDWLGSEPERQI
jgi:hypothetical protein